ncbi:hypothetical protein ES702_01481 [subsurface metagenome]
MQGDPPFRDATPSRQSGAISVDKLGSPDIWNVPQMIADSFPGPDTKQGSIAKVVGFLLTKMVTKNEPSPGREDVCKDGKQ